MSSLFDRKLVPHVRRIGPQWAQACAKIHAQSFAHPWSVDEFEALLAARDVIAEGSMAQSWFGRLLRTRRSLAGFVLSRRVLDEAEILTLAVAPKYRRRGVASALLSTHLAALAAAGAKKALFLEVEAGNDAALALYAHFGFYPVGDRKAYYRKGDGQAAAAIVMRRDFR
jgi:ribosomal-protein-alanine N-acetyltransferase